MAICRIPYYRNALRGLLMAALAAFCNKVYIVERPRVRGADSVNYRVQWV
jgi:hypothetical protein